MNTATFPSKKCLIFFSSPNKHGFTKQLLEQFMQKLPRNIEFETIDVYKTNIMPCIDCKLCLKFPCPFNSDGMDEILDKIEHASIIIVATPIYFNSVPSKFKAIIDRFQQLFIKKMLLDETHFSTDRVGILLTTGGSKDEFAKKSIHAMFEMFFGCIQADFIKHVCIMDTDHLGEIKLIDDFSLTGIIDNQ